MISTESMISVENALRQIVKVQDTTSEYREQLSMSKQILMRLHINALNTIRKDRAMSIREGDQKSFDVPSNPCGKDHSFFFASPQQMQGTLGRLAIRTTGQKHRSWSIIHEVSNITISYVSPEWFALRGIRLKCSFGNGKLNSLSFRVTPIISRGSEVFRLCHNGDLEALKDLFSRGIASPLATNSNFDTLLHVR